MRDWAIEEEEWRDQKKWKSCFVVFANILGKVEMPKEIKGGDQNCTKTFNDAFQIVGIFSTTFLQCSFYHWKKWNEQSSLKALLIDAWKQLRIWLGSISSFRRHIPYRWVDTHRSATCYERVIITEFCMEESLFQHFV